MALGRILNTICDKFLPDIVGDVLGAAVDGLTGDFAGCAANALDAVEDVLEYAGCDKAAEIVGMLDDVVGLASAGGAIGAAGTAANAAGQAANAATTAADAAGTAATVADAAATAADVGATAADVAQTGASLASVASTVSDVAAGISTAADAAGQVAAVATDGDADSVGDLLERAGMHDGRHVDTGLSAVSALGGLARIAA